MTTKKSEEKDVEILSVDAEAVSSYDEAVDWRELASEYAASASGYAADTKDWAWEYMPSSRNVGRGLFAAGMLTVLSSLASGTYDTLFRDDLVCDLARQTANVIDSRSLFSVGTDVVRDRLGVAVELLSQEDQFNNLRIFASYYRNALDNPSTNPYLVKYGAYSLGEQLTVLAKECYQDTPLGNIPDSLEIIGLNFMIYGAIISTKLEFLVPEKKIRPKKSDPTKAESKSGPVHPEAPRKQQQKVGYASRRVNATSRPSRV